MSGVALRSGQETIAKLQEAVADPLAGLRGPLKEGVARVLDGAEMPAVDARFLATSAEEELPYLCRAAAMLRDRGKGNVVTFSPKVFIPLTMLCRDFCGYCTFRKSPDEADRLYMTRDEVLATAKAGDRMGCAEALLTLGERPEQRYAEAKEWLSDRGHRTTLAYVREVSSAILEETGLLPHGNPGTMSRREMAGLRPVNASIGIMLENSSNRLKESGGPHELAPSKWPAVRMKTLRIAGELKIPFTTGILIGIGETRSEVVDSLLAIRDLHDRYGHIQEVIVQNFRAKSGTAMADHPDADSSYLLWATAAARLILGPESNVQVPPNLNARDYPVYLLAGINDWGGVSPLTIDYVNPEAPWPTLTELRRQTRAMGMDLKPRLTVYPEYITHKRDYLHTELKPRIDSMADSDGYLKGGMERYAESLS